MDSAKMTSHPRVHIKYDQPVDVLHIVLGEPSAYEGDGLPGGIELDFSIDDGAPCGAKVIGLKKYGWSARLDDLAALLSKHLSLEPSMLAHLIERKTTGSD
jgi:hypothetical protein